MRHRRRIRFKRDCGLPLARVTVTEEEGVGFIGRAQVALPSAGCILYAEACQTAREAEAEALDLIVVRAGRVSGSWGYTDADLALADKILAWAGGPLPLFGGAS